MTLTIKQKSFERRLRRAIMKYVAAKIDSSWKGTRSPEDYDSIELTEQKATQALDRVIKDILREIQG